MAVPKAKTSYSKQRMRRAHDKVTVRPVSACSHCGESRFPHHMCLKCGHYKGRKVMITKADRRELKREASES